MDQLVYRYKSYSLCMLRKYECNYNITTMKKSEQSISSLVFYLRHMELQPQKIQISESIQIRIKIHSNNSSSYRDNQDCIDRKFIFMLEETEEETPPLSEGQDYYFQNQLEEVGIYHLQCLNYPKIKSKIQILGKPQQKVIDLTEKIKVQSPAIELQKLIEVQQQKEEELKEFTQNRFQRSNLKSDYAQYDRILNDQEIQYDYTPNKYLQYFKEEFKLWRDFFQKQPEKPQKEYASQAKQKLSSGSLSFSERQSQKEESVISQLRSQQEVSDFQQQQLKNPKIMKKTNSESCYVLDREASKNYISSNTKRRPLNTNTSSPYQNVQQFEADTFIDWAYSWSVKQGYSQVNLKKNNDVHLVNQWFTFLQNKFKINQFLHG